MFKINAIQILFPLAVVSIVVNCYPTKNASCDCVCGLKQNDTTVGIDKNSLENPWTVGVFYGLYDNSMTLACSGSLISNEHVLVSATCAHEMARIRELRTSRIEIRMGNAVLLGDGVANLTRRNIKRTYIHENYKLLVNGDTIFYDFDIAIMQFDEAVLFGLYIQPICLPSPLVDYNNNTLFTVIGSYDSTYTLTYYQRYHRTKAQQNHIPIWMLKDCVKSPGYKWKITDNMLCAGDPENTVKQSHFHGFDYAQIIVEGENGSMELAGIYSFGSGGDGYSISEEPLVYTRVANFVPWIQSKLTKQCMCQPRNFIQTDSPKVSVLEKQTNSSLQSAKKGSCSCDCGHRGNHKRLIDGIKVTRPNRLPWVVGVYLESRRNFICSGALISNKHVICSAECASKLKSYRLKGTLLQINLGQVNTVHRGISNIYHHENWHNESMDFNIGLLHLDETISFGYNIQPICLPNNSSFVNYTGQMAIAAGFLTFFEPYLPSLSLSLTINDTQEFHVPIWSNKQCAELHYDRKITHNMICAGEYENGVRVTCINAIDFGQIVIEREHGRMELVGIYSFGTKCGSIGMPAVYTRVANLLPWIQKKITNQCTYAPKQTDYNDDLGETCIINQN